jgi:hypothetical protein
MTKFSIHCLQIIVILGLVVSCKKDDLYTSSDVKINEFMASNSKTAADQDGEYDDWIELYNNSDIAIDLSGYYLTDNHSIFKKWEVPSGTKIAANGYLIIWADNDITQSGLHANFNLSAEGEELLLITPDLKIADYVTYAAQSLKLSYSRIPNGTGNFSWQNPTYNAENIQTLAISQ